LEDSIVLLERPLCELEYRDALVNGVIDVLDQVNAVLVKHYFVESQLSRREKQFEVEL
jgi:hypothetical protein